MNTQTKLWKKALIYQEKLQKIKKVLLDPKNTALCTSTFRYWAKNKVKLQKISDSYIVLHVQTQNKKEAWNRISSKWGYCQQDLVEKFVTQSEIPIIERKFMSRLQ
ncbi:40628_t:CDS:2, partial [Gigaspora margarita]